MKSIGLIVFRGVARDRSVLFVYYHRVSLYLSRYGYGRQQMMRYILVVKCDRSSVETVKPHQNESLLLRHPLRLVNTKNLLTIMSRKRSRGDITKKTSAYKKFKCYAEEVVLDPYFYI